MVVGTNYTDLGHFDKAEEAYFQAVRISKVLDDKFSEAQIHYNLSSTYSAANRPLDCLNALIKSIRNKEWRQSVYYINSLYMATKELFLMDQKESVYYYKKEQGDLIHKENKVYEAKINIIYALLQDNQNETIEQCWSCIHFLQEKNDLDSVLDLSLIISQYCEEKKCYKDALEFSKRAILGEKKMRQLEGIG
ncbi:hypothetical protein [Bacillus sp. SIMBA_033]|uniref:hypothetical protein n=1 Tax=Bacillus sp. SIMBA_033 TaxID=3085776 RepID=UPI003978E2D3